MKKKIKCYFLFTLKTCLHPSEYDRAQTLLLCRSYSAIEADIIGHNKWSSIGQDHRFFIPITGTVKTQFWNTHEALRVTSTSIFKRILIGLLFLNP